MTKKDWLVAAHVQKFGAFYKILIVNKYIKIMTHFTHKWDIIVTVRQTIDRIMPM